MLAWCFAVIAVVPTPKTELHVVCVHEPRLTFQGQQIDQKVAVLVNRPGKDVTLVLSAYNPSTWQVLAAPGTNLKKVILAGYHTQAVEAPKGVEVVEVFHEGAQQRGQKDHLYTYYNIDSGRFRSSAQAVRRFTGMELSSFQGTYNYDATKPFMVNLVQNDERLRSDYPKLTPANELPKVAFQAAHFTHIDLGQFSGSFGDFTERGPDKNSLKPLPRGVTRLTFDPVGKKYYGIKGHEFHEVDLAKGTTEKLDPGPQLPEVSWPCGMTFDTKRNRVVAVTLGGIGQMYAYTPKTGRWAVPTDMNNVDLSALVYHAADDTLYGLAAERDGNGDGGVPTLYHYNAQGALLKTTRLGAPMFPGVIGRGPVEARVQMVSAGDHIAVLVSGVGARDDGNRQKAESFLFVIDPKTGKVKLAWKE